MSAESLQAMLAKTKKVAKRGEFEPFETSSIFDSTAKNSEWLGEEPKADSGTNAEMMPRDYAAIPLGFCESRTAMNRSTVVVPSSARIRRSSLLEPARATLVGHKMECARWLCGSLSAIPMNI